MQLFRPDIISLGLLGATLNIMERKVENLYKYFREEDQELYRKIQEAMAKDSKSYVEDDDVYGKGASNLEDKWEAYHLKKYVNGVVNRNKKLGRELDQSLDNTSLQSIEKFRNMPGMRGITEDNTKILFEKLAELQGKQVLECIVEFLEFCDIENRPLKLLELEDKTVLKAKIADIRKFLVEQNNISDASSEISVQDHLSVTKEIERIKENNGFYPYGKYGMKSKDRSKVTIAFKEVERLLEIIPGYVPLLILKIQFLALLGHRDEAFEISSRLYETEKQNIEVSNVHGGLLNVFGRREEAFKVFENAQSLDGGLDHPILAYNTASCLDLLNRRQEAVEEFRRAIALDSGFVKAYYALAALYQKTGQQKKSEVILKKALRIAPDETKLTEALIGVLKQQGKHDEANALIKNINHDELPEYKSGHLKAVSAFEENKFIESLEIMTELIRKQDHDDFVTDKDRAKAFADLACLYEAEYVRRKSREHYSLAKYYYEKSLDYNPEFSTALFKAAFFCLGDREYEKCREYLDRLAKTNNFECVKAEKIEGVYVALAVLARKHFTEIDYQIPFKWCEDKYPGNMECLIGQLHIYFEDKKLQYAKDFVNNLALPTDNLSGNTGITDFSKTIKLVGDALNAVDVQKIESGGYYTEEYLKILEACTTDEIKNINREFWKESLYSKCEYLQTVGTKNKDVERLLEAISCYQALLKETLAHEDLDKWRMINIEIGDVYNALWVNSGDTAYLEKGIECVNRLLLDTDVESDRYSWLIFAKYLAPRYLELYHEKSNREHLDEAIKLFEAVFAENEQLSDTVDIEPLFFLKAGDAYIELDKLEPDVMHLEWAVKRYETATIADDPKQLYDANFSIATTYQNIGLRTNDQKSLVKALAMVENFRDAVSKWRDPAEWAYNQAWSAEIRHQIGIYSHDLDMFLESAKAYKQALDQSKKVGISKEDHVYWSHGRGLSLLTYCQNIDNSKSSLITDSVKCFLSVLDVLTPDEVPWEYANTQECLGDAYLLLGQRKRNQKQIRLALDTFRDAISTFEKYSYAEQVKELQDKIHNLSIELAEG